jgi:aminoglycoside 6'-N-acetyltransferase
MIAFRPLTRADLPLLARWLEEPLVARWWAHDTSPDALERDFGGGIDGREAIEYLIALLDDRPFGLIQRYAIADDPDDLRELSRLYPIPDGAVGFDYLIGEPDMRGRGVGPAMIAALADRTPGRDILVPVAAGNRRSWRALEKAGFERIAEGELPPDNPRDPRDHYLYALRRTTATTE